MFATTGGNVRRNKLSDFVDVRRSGIIAMKLDDAEAIVDVQICTERDDVLLTAAGGQCIRFPVTDVRVFQGRTSMGVRGIALPKNDKLISLTILRHMDADADERAAYLRRANAVRRGGVEEEAGTDGEDASGAIELGEQRYVEMSASEQFVLTISENGYGKRSSSFEYRTTGRGGKGIVAMSVNGRNGKLVASFPVEDSDQIMLVTDKGQLIRCPVEGIRIAGRSTQGVIVFDTAEDEHVVSVEHIGDDGENGENGSGMAVRMASGDIGRLFATRHPKSPAQISISVPNSTTCRVGTPKNAAERSALRCRKANTVSRHTHMPGTSSLGMMVSRPM